MAISWVRIFTGKYESWPEGWTINGEGRNWKVEGRGYEGTASSWAEAKALAEKVESIEALNDEFDRQEALRIVDQMGADPLFRSEQGA